MKNNNLKNFIEETEKRFDKKFISTQVDKGYIEIEENEKLREELKSFITNHQIELLELVIKELEKVSEKADKEYQGSFPKDFYLWSEREFWFQKFQNIIQIIKEAIKHYENHTQRQ